MRAALLLALAAGCASSTPLYVNFAESDRSIRAEDYERVFTSWSRHAKAVVVHQGTVIETWGVYKSWEFRQAYVERYAKIYSLSDAEKAALYESQRQAARQAYEFHVAVQMTNYKWNDLDKASSPWRISLVDAAGAEIAPRRVELLKLPELYETQFFPNKTEFSQTYLIRFSRAEAEASGFGGPSSGRITLRIVSPLAKNEIVWQSK
ncbi:MAG TPA: hypothetical protein VN914_19240 [Polyangia bacterium]|nr:hypothetical protein [Polyangia bacterium]